MNNNPQYGTIGILTYDAIEDKVQCHICGRWFRGLNAHIWQGHRWTMDDYREEYGLNRNQSLICEGTKRKISQANIKLGLWKHLYSQTMSKSELLEFLRSIGLKPGYHLRPQECLLKAKLLTEYNPMNQPEVNERRVATERKTWYGTDRQRAISRNNLLNTIAKIRERNLNERRYACQQCGDIFAIREDLRQHGKCHRY